MLSQTSYFEVYNDIQLFGSEKIFCRLSRKRDIFLSLSEYLIIFAKILPTQLLLTYIFNSVNA